MEVFLQEKGKELWKNELRFFNTAVALGGFDAIHTGHIAIIKNVVEVAGERGLNSLVYLFCNQPRNVLDGVDSPQINALEKRLEILDNLGVKTVVAQWFTPEYLHISPEQFVKKYLVERLGAKYIAAGFNYRFGYGGRGDISLLDKLCKPFGIQVCSIPCVKKGGITVSSTRIRELISYGNIEEANACLDRKFSIEGTVIKGNQVGRTIGFPTANMVMPSELIIPKLGVYITEVIIDEKRYTGITNVGTRPTVLSDEPFIESHILDFSGDLYEKKMEVRFCHYLRDIVEFENLEKLKTQLEIDKKSAREYFS